MLLLQRKILNYYNSSAVLIQDTLNVIVTYLIDYKEIPKTH